MLVRLNGIVTSSVHYYLSVILLTVAVLLKTVLCCDQGPGSGAQDSLNKLLGVLKSYYHPSNAGPWTVSVYIICTLCMQLLYT